MDYERKTNRIIKKKYYHKSEYNRYMFNIGKYVGILITEVQKRDISYFNWAVEKNIIFKNKKGIYSSTSKKQKTKSK
jgi:hypothetical protein